MHHIKLSPPLPQLVFAGFCCCCWFWFCAILFAILFMLSPVLALLALTPMLPGGGAILKELLLNVGGGGMLNELVGFIGGGAMLKLEYGLLCCCAGGEAIEKLERPLEVLVAEVEPHGFEVSVEAPLVLLQSTLVP
jgi:hypothetical protein